MLIVSELLSKGTAEATRTMTKDINKFKYKNLLSNIKKRAGVNIYIMELTMLRTKVLHILPNKKQKKYNTQSLQNLTHYE